MFALRSPLRPLLACAFMTAFLLALLLAGCSKSADAPEYVARVGDQYLRPGQMRAALGELPQGVDSTAARRQVIRQWTTNALLYREAQERGLTDDPDVRERLEKSRQSVLVNALMGRLYDEMPDEPPPEAMQSYFERHREALRFTVSHVRLRHLATSRETAARAAHRRLEEAARSGAADTAWTALTRQYAADTARARRYASDLYAEPTLFSGLPGLRERLAGLEEAEIAPVFEAGGGYHVLQLVERVPAGTLPEFEWVKDEIRERVVLQRRKQMYSRQVERLRNRARTSGALETSE